MGRWERGGRELKKRRGWHKVSEEGGGKKLFSESFSLLKDLLIKGERVKEQVTARNFYRKIAFKYHKCRGGKREKEREGK